MEENPAIRNNTAQKNGGDTIVPVISEMYLSPLCPRCNGILSECLAAGNGLVFIGCGRTFFMTEGQTRAVVAHEP
jgi:hypothetical protein